MLFDYPSCRYEALVFVVMYIIYVIIMYFNPKLSDYFITKVDNWTKSRTGSDKDAHADEYGDAEKRPLLGDAGKEASGGYKGLDPSDGGPRISPQESPKR